MDFYLHELTKFGLMKIYEREWNITEKYSNIQVKMDIVEEALKNEQDSTWFVEFINAVYSGDTMTSFSSVKSQMNLIGFDVKEIADKAFYERGSREKTVEKLKRRITELYNRRNLIAHQSDREHKDAVKKDVSKDIVLDFIKDIKKIVEAIHNVALEKV